MASSGTVMTKAVTGALTASEVSRVLRRGLFTVTEETSLGYRVLLFRQSGKREPVLVSRGRRCARPQTARRHAAKLVRGRTGKPR
jgi:hypothetical protein